jgi:hypothetical protein
MGEKGEGDKEQGENEKQRKIRESCCGTKKIG